MSTVNDPLTGRKLRRPKHTLLMSIGVGTVLWTQTLVPR